MDSLTIIAVISIVMAGLTMAIGSIAPAIGEAKSLSAALTAIAQQPDEVKNITRTLFVGLAMIESLAIYCLVIILIVLFRNPLLEYIVK